MLRTINRIPPTRSTLRCVWVPVHTGANAPLTAVWIETSQAESLEPQNQEYQGQEQQDQEQAFEEQAPWPRAA